MNNMAERDTVSILGVDVDRVDMGSAISRMERLIAGGGSHQVVVLNLNSVMAARTDNGFRKACRGASLVLPDGVPLLWASRFLGRPIPGRVAGPDLLRELSWTAAHKGYSCFLLGSTPEVLDLLSRRLVSDCPGLRIVGSFAPPISDRFSAKTNQEIARRVNDVSPDILWVSMGAPKQEKWIHEVLGTLDARLVIGAGGAFEMHSGRVRRAPFWMQKAGLEWFFRFSKEPGRLFSRYFVKGAPFFPLLFLQGVRQVLRHRTPAAAGASGGSADISGRSRGGGKDLQDML